MKNILISLAILASFAAQAKTLTVGCESKNGNTLEFISDIPNVNTPQTIKSLEVNGTPVSKFRDISKMPIYRSGNIHIQIQFGTNLYSSAELILDKCTDDFEATGSATVQEYVGGFAGTSQSHLTCTCSLK